MRSFRSLYSLVVLFACVCSPLLCVLAQQTVTLGNATVPLTGPWKFHIGDNMAWAQPGFDDSGWSTMDLTPPPGSYDPIFGSSGFVPGWTARGYKGYSGYAWYRLRVNIQDGQSALALKMPDNFDDAYQVYVNGQLVDQFGRFTSRGVTSYISQPRAFSLPANFQNGTATIAVRIFMEPFTALTSEDAGGLHGPPVLGHAAAIAGLLHLDWDAVNRSLYSAYFEMAILLLALLVAFALFWLDRTEPAYLWLGLVCAAILAWNALAALSYYSPWIGEDAVYFFTDAVLGPVIPGLWVIFWAYWFRLGGMARLHRMVWSAVVLWGLSLAMMRPPLYGSVVPVHASVWLVPLTDGLQSVLGVLLVWVAIRGIRKNKAEGWLALPALIAAAFSEYAQVLFDFLHRTGLLFLFGISYSIGQVGTVLSLIMVTILLLRRFLHSQREREKWKLEIEQARQIQSILVPVKAPPTPGFAVESVYLPAGEVGGDFFHLRPEDDGSLLIVVGDVSGKGLKAAMTVSTIVGALRGCTLREPAAVLAYLNRVLYGQIKGFATCCACRIDADGTMIAANAGHIPPYRNGEEVPLAGDTPLGILPDASYGETRFQLSVGDRLAFVSDGVVEATNAKRELFGFERTQQISDQPAHSIAHAAEQFGQEDDITVVRVVMEGTKVAVSASDAASSTSMQIVESV